MKKLFNWIIDKLLAGFILLCIGLVAKVYFDLPVESRTNFFSFSGVREILNIRISLWVVLIIVICLIIITRIEKYRLKSKFNSDEDDYLNVPKNFAENYRGDVFGVSKTKWTWSYEWRSDHQKFLIVNLKPSCPTCDTPMRKDPDNPYLLNTASCHKCRLEGKKFSFEIQDNIRDIEDEIIRRAKMKGQNN